MGSGSSDNGREMKEMMGCYNSRDMGGKRCDITGQKICYLNEMGLRRWDNWKMVRRDERTKRV